MRVIYDGSVDGFFSIVYEVYYTKLNPSMIEKTKPSELVFEDIYEIETNVEYSKRVQSAIAKRFSKCYLDNIKNTFLCDSKDFEMYLLGYIILGFKNEKNLKNINHKSVFYIDNLIKELFRLVHKFSGYCRFEELSDGVLYAKIDTHYNILPHLASHFVKRLNTEDFIIHDTKREIAYIKNNQHSNIYEVKDIEAPTLSDSEEKFQKLWRTFFDSVTIKERENKELQRQNVPLKYRKYMMEFD
jgi:probable DNA metabolism protein